MSQQKSSVRLLLKHLGNCFSKELGISLEKTKSQEIFKWFLASILFGARISETIVVNTYKEFERRKVLTPQKILKTGWDGLVEILDAGGYVRYDFKTATKLLEIMKALIGQYNGNLNLLHSFAKNSSDLEIKLRKLGKGIGEVTVNIFLRELRGIWEKAKPLPQELAITAARNLGLTHQREPSKILEDLEEEVWKKTKIPGKTFIDFETSLVRLGKDYCRKKRCDVCKLSEWCRNSRYASLTLDK
ncbi:MAG: hypothetical protein AB1393_00660 [Candidatus Edwardsbacteria bacterium]